MAMTLELVAHVAGGAVGLVSGVAALIAKKGGLTHRQAGNIFFTAMAIMAISGAYIAWFRSVNITVLAGALTLYLVTSSWLSVKSNECSFGVLQKGVFIFGLGVTGFGAFLCWKAFHGVTDSLGAFTVPAAIYFIFTSIALLAVVTDFWVLIRGGIAGKARVIRHLWRMCVPLYVAASSFFTGQQQLFPERLHGTVYLSIPEYTVLLTMFFWLARVWITWPSSMDATERPS